MRSSRGEDRLTHGGLKWLIARVLLYVLLAVVVVSLALSHLPAPDFGSMLA